MNFISQCLYGIIPIKKENEKKKKKKQDCLEMFLMQEFLNCLFPFYVAKWESV